MDADASAFGTIVNVVIAFGGLSGYAALIIAWYQNRPLQMLTDAQKAKRVLPAWFIERMMQDQWLFGLMTAEGKIIVINRINAFSTNGKWIDVSMAINEEILGVSNRERLVVAVHDDRRHASVNISHIVAAFDLQSS